MAYLFVSIALVFLTVKGYCGKKTGNCMRDTGDAFLFSLVRMLLCIVIGLVPVAFDNAWQSLALDGGMTAICLLAGVSNAAFLVGWILAIQKNSMVTVDVTLTVGSIIPAVLCMIFFHEAIRLPKLIGFFIIILASFILSGYNKQEKGKHGLGGVVFLAFAAVGEGMVSFSQQLYKQYYASADALGGVEYPMSVYHFYTYVFAGAFLLVFFAVYEALTRRRARKNGAETVSRLESLKKPFPYIVVMAVCLFVASYFQTIATSTYGMSSQVMYPLIKGVCLITVTIVAQVFFGERITKRSVLGSLTALVGIVVMSVF